MPLEEINLGEWAKKTVGCSGADLANLCRHASSQAIKRTFGLQRLINPDIFTDEELSELKITEQDFELGLKISHHGQLLNADQRQLDVSNLKMLLATNRLNRIN